MSNNNERKLSRRSFLTALGATVALAACAPSSAPGGASTDTGSGASAPSAEAGEVTVWGFAQPGEEARAAYATEALGRTIIMSTQDTGGQGAEAVQKFLTAVAGGTTAPVVIFDRFQIASYGHRNAFTPLDDLMARDEYSADRFDQSIMVECYGIDGNIYGLPRHFVNRYFFTNTEHFEEAGLDPTAGVNDWETYRKACEALTQFDSSGRITRVGSQPTNDLGYTWGWSNGGRWISDDARTATMNAPENVEAFEAAVAAADAMGGQEAVGAFSSSFQSGAGDPFLVGQASMKFNGNSFLRNVALYTPDLKFHTSYFPTPSASDPRFTWTGGHAWVIPRGTEDVDGSWEIIKTFLSYEANVAYQEAEKAISESQGAAYVPMLVGQPEHDAKFVADYKSGVPDIDAAFEFGLRVQTEAQNIYVRPQSPAASEMWDAVGLALEETLRKTKTADQALTEANDKIQAVLDEAWSIVS